MGSLVLMLKSKLRWDSRQDRCQEVGLGTRQIFDSITLPTKNPGVGGTAAEPQP